MSRASSRSSVATLGAALRATFGAAHRRASGLASASSLVVAFALAGAGPLETGCNPAPRASHADLTDVDEDTTLGTGDVFEIRVYGEDDLSADYRVDQEGTIDFPLVGQVEVAGLEPGAIAALISSRLREGGFLVAPHVACVVREYNSKRISVLGAVRTPGSYPLRSGMGVIEALGLAGGFTALANHDGTVITRRRAGEEVRRISAPVDRITNGTELDVPLRNGDIITVPERIF